ncbi:MAG: T9SS type A sorting domain-containing protein [Bacteroidales bacterium]|nr:T9SS type A sorting domain-containing protein [Bacteroidales bacterium]
MSHLKSQLISILFALTLFLSLNSLSIQVSAQIQADRSLFFSVGDTGIAKPIRFGLDTAWPDDANMRRGIAFMGADNVKVVRASFQPTMPLVNGDLQTAQINDLNNRLRLINMVGPHTEVMLNCDHPSVDPWYTGHPENWAQLMDVTTRRVQEKGRRVVTISPFNEPDYGWGQDGLSGFYAIAGVLRTNPRFDTIRISGGNTLNTDQALNWYNQLKDRLDEGNTHQLAGSFDNYANFYKAVRANGHHATNDELHNVMEAMVGVEYGMQTGVWWGTAELARGEFVKASNGKRLAYAEHRPNWTAASVYRHTNGKVQAFFGSSERQAVTTSYDLVSTDRDLYFDGEGPQRLYTLVMPGGTGYQTGQTNAERVVNITWGEDIQPVVGGKYKLVNRHSGKILEVANASTSTGANIWQNQYSGGTHQQWNVTPVSSRVGGDFSYFSLTAVNTGFSLDVLNWSLDNGGSVILWNNAQGGNQQWFLEYAENGWFYIRSRHSSLCLGVVNNSLLNRAYVRQQTKTGAASQQWRFLAVDAVIDTTTPPAPTGLMATPLPAAVRLTWEPSSDTDTIRYSVFRADSANGPFQTLARNLVSTAFVDSSAENGQTYHYAVRATDGSLNRSNRSATVAAASTGARSLIAQYSLDEGTSHLALPTTLFNHNTLTIAAKVYWKGGANLQRILDAYYDQNNNLYLTPNTFEKKMRFAIKVNGKEQRLIAAPIPVEQWTHIAVTLGDSLATLYVNGIQAQSSATVTNRPNTFKPMLNYLGKGYAATAQYNGAIDDFKVFNYALSAQEVAALAGIDTTVSNTVIRDAGTTWQVWPNPATEWLHLGSKPGETGVATLASKLVLYDLNGRAILSHQLEPQERMEMPIRGISAGTYILMKTNSSESTVHKVVIKP